MNFMQSAVLPITQKYRYSCLPRDALEAQQKVQIAQRPLAKLLRINFIEIENDCNV